MDVGDGLDVRRELTDSLLHAFNALKEFLLSQGLRSGRLQWRLGICAVLRRHGRICVRHILRVCWTQGARLRVLRGLRVIGVAVLKRRRRVELRIIVLCRRVSYCISCCALLMAYSSAVRVGRAVAAAAIRVGLATITCLGLAVRVSAVLLVILRHDRQLMGWIESVGAMVSESRGGAARQTRKLAEGCADGAQAMLSVFGCRSVQLRSKEQSDGTADVMTNLF